MNRIHRCLKSFLSFNNKYLLSDEKQKLKSFMNYITQNNADLENQKKKV